MPFDYTGAVVLVTGAGASSFFFLDFGFSSSVVFLGFSFSFGLSSDSSSDFFPFPLVFFVVGLFDLSFDSSASSSFLPSSFLTGAAYYVLLCINARSSGVL